MILDSLHKVSAAQQVTADAVSTSSIDLTNVTPKRNVFEGEPMGFLVIITAIGTTTGSTKLQAIQATDAALTTSIGIVGELDLATAQIVAGAQYVVACSQGLTALRYIGMQHDITGTVDYTVDAYFGALSMIHAKSRIYAKGYTIS